MGTKLVRLRELDADESPSAFSRLIREERDRIRRDVFMLLHPQDTESGTLLAGYTVVYPGCSTNGHAHADREEVYHFVRGRGVMVVDGKETEVAAGDTFYVPYGPFHTTRNPSNVPLEYFWITIAKKS
jgi:mannose-6-phosphate isomerase-like protein (cupin superfamily)